MVVLFVFGFFFPPYNLLLQIFQSEVIGEAFQKIENFLFLHSHNSG